MTIRAKLYSALLAGALLLTAGQAGADEIIRIASGYPTTTLDPARSAAAGNIETFGQLYARLVRRNADGSLEPGLAESWNVSDDGKTVTLTLRDAKFSDGSPITADDVVFSLLRVRDLPDSAYSAPLQQMADAKAIDAKTVEITLKTVFAPFIGNLEVFNTGIVSKADVEKRGEKEAFAGAPVTSGPYMVKEWKPNDRLVLAANPNYWRTGYPKNDGAELIEVGDENTRVTMMISGDVDAVRGVPWSQVADLQSREGISVPLEPSTVIFMTLLNHARAPFDDLKVRQAAAHAIDTKAVTKAMTFGHAQPANTTLPGALDFHDKSNPGIAYDPAAAKSLLEGKAPADPLVILITDNPESERLAVMLQAQWAAVGLNSKIEKVDSGVWWDRVPKGDYDAAPTWWYNETPDPDLALRWALCGSCGSKSFYTNYNNPTVNELTEAGAAELDTAKRAEIYRQVQEITTREVSQIPLYYPPYSNAYSKRVTGLMMTPSLQWTLEEAEVVQ
jgi:peptide/nickel transport system substrate-binding protein